MIHDPSRDRRRQDQSSRDTHRLLLQTYNLRFSEASLTRLLGIKHFLLRKVRRLRCLQIVNPTIRGSPRLIITGLQRRGRLLSNGHLRPCQYQRHRMARNMQVLYQSTAILSIRVSSTRSHHQPQFKLLRLVRTPMALLRQQRCPPSRASTPAAGRRSPSTLLHVSRCPPISFRRWK